MASDFFGGGGPWGSIVAAILAAITGLGWLFRLEGRSTTNSQSLADEKREREKALYDLEERLAKQREEDRAQRHQDWTHMESQLTQIQADIRELLQRTAGK